jgi:5-methyltetrahydrofolate--homocysteine methyltransferase
MLEFFQKMSDLLVIGDTEGIKNVTHQALDKGVSAQEILEKGLIEGMGVVGERFKICEMFIPEVIRSANTMHAAMDVLRPLLSESDAKGLGTVVIGTVEGDLHDIGKNLVAMMLEGAGFKVVNIGTDVKPKAFVKAVKEHKAEILAMSALLTTTMPKMKETITAILEAGIRDQVKIMAGGAQVTKDFVNEIGGDAYGFNAGAAVDEAKALVGK